MTEKQTIEWTWRRFLAIGVFAICLGLLGLLGTWQASRFLEKRALFAQMDANQAKPVLEVSSASELTEENDYRTVQLVGGTLELDKTVVIPRRFHKHLPGAWPFTPYRFADGSVVIVHSGWVPEDQPAAIDNAPALLQGLLFTPGRVKPDELARGDESFSLSDKPVLGEPDTAFLYSKLGGTPPPRENTLVVLNGPAEPKVYPTPSFTHITDPYLTPAVHAGYSVLWYSSGLLLIWIFWAGWTGRLDPSAR